MVMLLVAPVTSGGATEALELVTGGTESELGGGFEIGGEVVPEVPLGGTAGGVVFPLEPPLPDVTGGGI
jgi:hypothetical protein